MTEPRGLGPLLAPASVALVGASDDPRRAPGRPLRYLRRDGWAGRVYPVNPRRPTVQGERAWPSLAALPEVPEHVFVLTPTDTVVDVVEECGRLGVAVATVLAGGFGEAGPPGAAHQDRLRAAARAGGVRLLGPSGIGVVDTRTGFTMTANAAFVDGGLPTGSTVVVSQSGSVIGALVSRGRARGIGFAVLVAVGGEADLTVGEICAATLDDPSVDCYALFLETLQHADDLRRFALQAAARGKAVVAYKLGRSAAGAELAVTHTGALAGADDVAQAFLADCGIARVDTVEGLLEGSVLASRVPVVARSGAPRVGVLTASGGGAAMVVDQLGVRGLAVAGPTPATLARVAERVGFDVGAARIVDLTLRGTDAAAMGAALGELRTSDEFDLVVQVLGSSAASQPDEATRPAREAPAEGCPVAVFVVPEAPEALATLAAHGVGAFRTPEACADVVAALLARRPPRPSAAVAGATGSVATLDEAASLAVLDALGVPRVPTVAVDRRGAVGPLPFAYPVVVKALAAGLAHKTEAGGVVLDVADEEGVRAAIDAIRSRLAAGDDVGDVRFLVQPMVPAVTEVLVGFRRDAQIGPVVVVAPGGVLAELHDQRSVRVAPVDLAEARRMVEEVPLVAAVVHGYRGAPPGALDALAAAISALSSAAGRPDVVEVEVNPLLVGVDGVHAVDALARVVASPPEAGP